MCRQPSRSLDTEKGPALVDPALVGKTSTQAFDSSVKMRRTSPVRGGGLQEVVAILQAIELLKSERVERQSTPRARDNCRADRQASASTAWGRPRP